MKPAGQGPQQQDRQHAPKQDEKKRQEDQVDEAGEESFPASDPPSYNPQKTGD